MKPQRKDAGGRKSEQHPNHQSYPKPSYVQSAIGSAHLESDSTANNEHARTDHQSLKKILVYGNHPSSQSSSLLSFIKTTVEGVAKACMTAATVHGVIIYVKFHTMLVG